MQRLIAMIVLLGVAGTARADWVELGAATYCSPEGSGFWLLPTVQTADEATTIAAPMGYDALPMGQDQTVFCKVGSSLVALRISRYPPQERGQGQGLGVMTISHLTINGREVFERDVDFNWNVLDEPVLTSVSVRPAAGHIALTQCQSTGFDWGNAYGNQHCDVRLIDK